ncbi:hypothetical protein B0J11DRAFT_187498 [Dendryphion nanum]|uniref:Uncharacterized protein n=1 Tax=Dendryphion nanum TaxID=256645 RepID=A0A9P9I8P1_9PLEO|nr:hypothetical protein B0J11DRAFT_187498 [Dendryphion nanum]
MKFSTLFTPAFLVAAALASDSESSESSSSSSSSASASSSPTTPKLPDPTPIGELWTAKWSSADLSPYKKKCTAQTTITAEIYKLGEMYPSLKTWAPELKVFYNKQHYPGSWKGEDKHGNERELLKLGMGDLPFAVREWIKGHPRQRHFSVQDDVVFFAPGAIYPILPLFVDESEEGAQCDDILEDLDNYSAELKDGAVVGTVEHKRGKDKEVEIVVSAFQVVKADKTRDEL